MRKWKPVNILTESIGWSVMCHNLMSSCVKKNTNFPALHNSHYPYGVEKTPDGESTDVPPVRNWSQ